MKRLEPESLGDILRRTLQDQGITGRLNETKAVAAWPFVVGNGIASMCGKPFVHNGVMNVTVRSAPLRQSLNMSRSSLVEALNEAVGTPTLSDIRFK